MAGLNHTATTEGREDFQPLNPGTYRVAISESELKQSKSGSGQYLKLKLIVLDGPDKDRTLFDNLNLYHDNATTVKIAKQTLDEIILAVAYQRQGLKTVSDSSELHNIPMDVEVGVQPAQGNYGPSNVIKKYKAPSTQIAYQGMPPTGVANTTAPQQGQQVNVDQQQQQNVAQAQPEGGTPPTQSAPAPTVNQEVQQATPAATGGQAPWNS